MQTLLGNPIINLIKLKCKSVSSTLSQLEAPVQKFILFRPPHRCCCLSVERHVHKLHFHAKGIDHESRSWEPYEKEEDEDGQQITNIIAFSFYTSILSLSLLPFTHSFLHLYVLFHFPNQHHHTRAKDHYSSS